MQEKQRKLKKYNEACEAYEKQMFEDLERQSNNLKKSSEVKAYIAEVKSLAKEHYKDENYPVELTDWINWAENYAAELNPLSKGLPTYQKVTETLKLEDIE